MKAVIFVGPSVSVSEAAAVLDATYLPPAAMGDIYAALARKPDVIGLIDGMFEQVPAVWHKEILFALSSGVPVYGAASMGALRAAELHAFGMRGVGSIFEAYASGDLEDDDEVAVAHRPADGGFSPVSEAMVNIRFGLERAESEKLISPETREALVRLAKQTFYPERSWALLRQLGVDAGLPASELEALFSFVRKTQPNAKRDDAIALLERIRDDGAKGVAPHVPSFEFQSSVFWERTKESKRRSAADPGSREHGGVSQQALIRHVRLSSNAGRDAANAALLAHLAAAEAERCSIAITEEELEQRVRRHWRELGLPDAGAAEAWLTKNGFDEAQYLETLRNEALVEKLFEHHRADLDEPIERELKLRQLFTPSVAAVEQKARLVAQKSVHAPTPADIGLTEEALLSWYREYARAWGGVTDAEAFERSDLTHAELVRELVGLYLLAKSEK